MKLENKNEFKQKVDLFVNLFNELTNYINDFTNRIDYVSIQEQLKSINKNISSLENKKVTVPVELRELKNRLLMELSDFEDFEELISKFQSTITSFKFNDKKKSSLTSVVPTIKKKSSNTPEQLIQVVDIANLVWKSKLDYNTAFKHLARRNNILPGTVRSNCTRAIGLNTSQFSDLLMNKSSFKDYLLKVYPNHQNYIMQAIS